MVYLDNAATTGQKPECVLRAVTEAMQTLCVNAGRGSYALARRAVGIIDACRERLLRLGKIRSGYHVYLAPSATVALNEIILGLELDRYSNVYASPFEHNAVMRPLRHVCDLSECGLLELPFDRDTQAFDLQRAEDMFLEKRPGYVFACMVSNVTGYMLPVREIAQLAHKCGARVIVDCAQAFGAVDANLAEIGADAYVFAGHKTLLAPFGIAGFFLSDDWKINPGLFGGTGSDSLNLNMPSAQAGGCEPGSINVPAVCGLNAACEFIETVGIANIYAHERRLIDRLAAGLSENGKVLPYLPPKGAQSGILAFNVEGYSSRDVGEIFDDEFGIAVRTGYQCAPWVHGLLNTAPYGGVVRASVSYFSTENDIDALLRAVASL